MPLAPGQTNIQQNAEFDSRILARGAVDDNGNFITPSKTSLYRGRVETADMYNGYTWRLQFLFNPTSFTHNGQIDPNVNLKAAKDNPDYKGSSAAFQEIQQNIGFSL